MERPMAFFVLAHYINFVVLTKGALECVHHALNYSGLCNFGYHSIVSLHKWLRGHRAASC